MSMPMNKLLGISMSDLDSDMDDVSDQVKEVYAYYGLAMYWAQCLEQSIFQHLLFLDHFPRAIKTYKDPQQWANDFDEYESREMKQTMGKLIRRLREAGQPTKEIESALEEALKVRNWLAHGYFSDRAIQFTVSSGRQEMLIELESLYGVLQNCASLIDAVTQPVIQKMGLTEEIMKDIEKQLVSEYYRGEPNA